MSIVTLNPQVKKKIEAELNVNIPTPDEAAFEGFVESLRLTHPELHQELILGLKVTPQMPAEKAVTKAARRARLRNLFDQLFFLTKWPNQRVLDKKRVVYAGLAILMLLFPAAYLFGSDIWHLGHKSETALAGDQRDQGQEAQPAGSAFAGVRFPSQALVSTSKATQVRRPWVTGDVAIPIPPKSPPPPSSPSFTPFPRDIPPPVEQAAVVWPTNFPNPMSRQDNAASVMAQPPAQLTVAASSPRPEQLLVWQQASTPTLGIGRVGGFESEAVTKVPVSNARGLAVFEQVNQALPLTTNEAEDVADTDLLLKVAPIPRSPVSLTMFSREPSEAQSLSVSSGSGLAGVQAGSASRALAAPPQTDAPPVSNDIASTPQSPRSVITALQAGRQLPAVLATGITVTDKNTVPAIAETKGDWCADPQCPDIIWLGTARLSPGDRVAITFTEAIVENTSSSVSAVAVGEDNMMGLPVTIQAKPAEVAQALLQSAAGGASAYLETLTNQTRVTFKDDTVIQEGQIPGIETFILGRLAELLSPPTAPTVKVQVATIPAGTPLRVLYGVGNP